MVRFYLTALLRRKSLGIQARVPNIVRPRLSFPHVVFAATRILEAATKGRGRMFIEGEHFLPAARSETVG